jgi:4'-phosphopantetheinyl transferase
MSVDRWPPGPRAPLLSDGTVDVWRAELDAPGWESAAALSPAERDRAERLREGTTRRRWVASRHALRAVLGRYLGGDEELPGEFVFGPRGKPALPGDAPPIRFNLSHSVDLALVAVMAGSEVGIDVELVDSRRDVVALVPHALDRDSGAVVLAAPPAERVAAFYRAWVRREAIAKCSGEGLGGESSGVGIAVRSIELDAGHAAALAVDTTALVSPRYFTVAPS